MAKRSPGKKDGDGLAEAKRIMGRLANTPHKPHKDEAPRRAPPRKGARRGQPKG